MVTVPDPPEPISSSTAARASFAAGDSSSLANAKSTSLGSRITVRFDPPACPGPSATRSTGFTFVGFCPAAFETAAFRIGSSTSVGDPAGCTGTATGRNPSMNAVSSVVSAGGAVNTAVTVTALPGGTWSPLLSLIRPSLPCAVSVS
jgi:hypothetical protein